MRFVRVGEVGAERPGVLDGDSHYYDISGVVSDLDAAFWAGDFVSRVRGQLESGNHDFPLLELAGQRVGSPIARPHQILCVGLNYDDHITESKMARPSEPLVFTKAPNSICGPTDQIVRPKNATKLDYEVELGVVIGRRASYLASDEEALASIGGFVLVNDVSERAFQLEREGQWMKGKSAETFNPCGPILVTPDEVGPLDALELTLSVNGEVRQTGTTADMLVGVAEIMRYLSQFMVLEPGDLINTGTPPGVGLGMNPPRYLQPGDVVECEINGLGQQRNVIRDYQ